MSTLRVISVAALAVVTVLAAGAVASEQKLNPIDTTKAAPEGPLFVTSHDCMACHNGLEDAAGQDISIGTDWRSTMMGNAARDPYWQAGVRREILDHPEASAAIQAECSICHMPMARSTLHAHGHEGRVFDLLPNGGGPEALKRLARDGVSCTLCHQIGPEKLGDAATFSGRFAFDTRVPLGERAIHGPYEVDAGRTRIMNSAALFLPKKAAHIRESGLCGSCHTLYTHSLGPGVKEGSQLAEQMPYQEWMHSRYPATDSCQSCHMQPVEGSVQISSVWGQPREDAMQHVFKGANFFVPRLLNSLRTVLEVEALPAELQASSERAVAHLKDKAARIELADSRLSGDRLEVAVEIANLAGHKLPSAYPSRRVWIHLNVVDAQGATVFESGRLNPDGSIQANDNDADPAKIEPHYTRIDSADQVQIYEPILGGPDGKVTTGLLTATQYLKDNRLLPEGFDKATAEWDVAVAGNAGKDLDFIGGGDRVDYSLVLGGAKGPFKIKAELYYQPIGYRWAYNLERYQAEEPQRFIKAYRAAADRSAVVLAADEIFVSAGGE